MTPEQLINEAKKHLAKVHTTGGGQVCEADFPKVDIQYTAMISFESDARNDQVSILLERDSGRLVTIMYSPN